MKRLIFILLLCKNFVGFGQKSTEVDISNLPTSVKPGQHFSVFFNIKQSQLSATDVKSQVILPENWKILTEKKLKSDSLSQKYLYTISTPSQANSGNYIIDFQAITIDSIIYNRKVNIYLEEIRNLEIIPLSQPEFVKEGDVLRVEYLIQNTGNKTEYVKLETTRGIVENIKDSVEIKPNSYKKVVVKQDIPHTDVGSWQTSSDLKASFQNRSAPIFQTVSVPVYSSKIKKNDPYLRLPIEIGGGYMSYTIGKKTTSAYQYFADGKGFLDFAKKHYLDFTLRGPNQFAFPAIGNYDQYSASYSYLSKTHISVGDYALRFNNLMEFGRFGRGINAEHNVGNTNFMAFYQKARFFPDQKDAFGGSYKLKLKGESNISFQFISKNLVSDKSLFRSNLLGVSSYIKKNWFNNETEIALGHAKNKFDIGIFNRLNLTYKLLNINSELIYAGKEFYGFYTNSLLIANGINYHLNRKWAIGISSNISRINPSLDALKYAVSPYATTNMAFVSYQPNSKNLFFINFTKQEREDRQKPSSFHFKEDFGNFSYNLNAQKFTTFVQARYGFAKNLMSIDSNAKKISTSCMIQPSVALLPWFWVGGYFEYQHTSKFSASNNLQNLYYYGGNIRLNYKKNLSLNFMYRNNYAPDEFFEKRSFMDGTLTYDTERHQINITAGRFFIPNLPNNEQNTLFVTARYVHKLNMPLKKDKKLGHLKGQIINISKDINREGILLQLGQYKVMSDSNGFFSFPNLKPDKYFVTISSEANLVGVVATIKTPIEVEINADSTEKLIIPLIKTGGVIGRIEFENLPKDTPSVKPIIYIKLSNEKESIITQMNDKNEFSFKEIKPGFWKLKAVIPGKTEQLEISNQEQEVEIESGKIKQHVFSVKTIERKIKFSGKNFHIAPKQ